MKRILLGILTVGAVSSAAVLATNAFFSDTETSAGNTFQAGKLDLKISSQCHYYQNDQDVGCPQTSSWQQTSLNTLSSAKFFDFSDVKPGDYGENTVDFAVDNNPAWMCGNLHVTSDTGLSPYLSFVWWVDDGNGTPANSGNNKLDVGEKVLYGGPRLLSEWLTLPGVANNTLRLTFADSYLNWLTWPGPTPPNTTPIPGNTTQYLGIGWCFGAMSLNAGTGVGFTCDGSVSNNAAQGTSVVADLTFDATQFRNQPTFLCPEHQPK